MVDGIFILKVQKYLKRCLGYEILLYDMTILNYVLNVLLGNISLAFSVNFLHKIQYIDLLTSI